MQCYFYENNIKLKYTLLATRRVPFRVINQSEKQMDFNETYIKLKCILLATRRVPFRVINQFAKVHKMAKKNWRVRQCEQCLAIGSKPPPAMLTMPGLRQC
ncbi:hypothetical protein M0804_005056 [Polistes exclamans]|nr:hypothetical protein M0804_005056 [Polistes exclamans]